ncbi:ABC transporter ATP-binding protein, partial [Candidatus Roizmanbacteria bacterium]|nr:ABC transporter ATP-binding protein [Candidatus Roizmanbacteria bacterium]
IVSLQNFLGNLTNFLLPTLVQTVFIIGVLFYYNWIVAAFAFFIFPLYLWISQISTKRWGIHQNKRNTIEDETRGRIQEVIANIKLVRSFNMQEKEWQFVSKRLKKSVAIYDVQSKEYHLLNFLRNFGLEIGLIAIAWIVFRQTFLGVLTFGELVLMFQLFNQLRRPLFAMSFILEQIKQAETGSKEFFEILSLPSAESFTTTIRKPTVDRAAVTFENVSFAYNEGEAVLTNVSFSIKHGETIALVGHSGAGKTTVTNLILKFYDPTSGRILLNGNDYAKLSHQDIRSNVALVFQDSELFSTTVRENVSYGKLSASDDEIKRALKKANAYDFVMKFPKKLDTEIGERGIKLSGGQKQRVQIARAILHDAPILILDEATSSLDAKSEKEVQNALENLMKNRLVIIIAHRFSTIQNAGRIIVIDDGKIVDSGNPQALARKKGIYSELLQYQIEGNRKLLEKYELH